MRGVSKIHNVVVASILALFVAFPVCAENYLYTVRPGDTLWDLSEKYLERGVAYTPRLQKLNQVEDPEHLQPGSKLHFPIRWLKIQPAPATIVSVSGTATALIGEDKQAQSLAKGQQLTVGDAVVTGPDGNVAISFADGSRLIIRSDSEVIFDILSAWGDTGMADTRMRLQRGRVDAEVAPATGPASRYEIHTPAAISAVRGTVYRMHADSDQSVARTEVLTGKVAVSGEGRSRRVPATFGVVAEKGKPPQPPRRLLSRPDVSGLAERFERMSIKFSWPDLKGARAYRVQVADNKNFETLRIDRTVPGPDIDRISLGEDGDYHLKVRGVDEVGLEGLDAVHKFVLDARPQPPMSMQPVRQKIIRESQPQFRWTVSEKAAGYRFQLAAGDDFGAPLFDVELKDQSSFSPPDPLSLGTYYWRIATRDEHGELGPYGDVEQFTYQLPPPGPTHAPPDVTDEALGIRWSKVEGAQSYHLQIASDMEFSDLLVDQKISEPSYVLPRPGPGRYYIRVATVEPDGYQGPYGTVQSAEVPGPAWWKPLLIWLVFVAIAL